MENTQISLPIITMKEGEWFVASCPQLDIATQGKTEQEVRENMEDLIGEYLEDEDTINPEIESKLTSLSFLKVEIPKERNKWADSNHLTQER
ncbi:hypothetical protein CMI42_04695 [Candidatus Pacearchaeota archaeon]|nr:hypothetical protein [Candidatus Pacearchaeota archaeon]